MKRHILALIIVVAARAQSAAPESAQSEINEFTDSLMAGLLDADAEKGVLITTAGRYETEGKKIFVEIAELDASHIRLLLGTVGKEPLPTGEVVDSTSTVTWKDPFTVIPNRWAVWLSKGRADFYDGAEKLLRFDRFLTRIREAGGYCEYPRVLASAPKLLKEWIAKKGPNQPPEPTAMSVTPPAAQESRQP